MNNPYIPKAKKVIKVVKESSDTISIFLDWQIKHDPGQFVQVSLLGIGEAPISISSYSDKYVELSVRMVGNLTNSLGKIKKGDNLFVRGPYGKGYPTHYFKGNNIIIIGGGCGIAPLKGVIEYIEKNISEFKDIYLFFGFRLPDELLFREQLSRWQNKFKLQVSFDKIPNKTCLEGRAGFITQLIEESNLNNQNKIVIICGPPVMMSKTIQILQNRGFNNDQIFISMERLMNCGIGKCGHCMIHGKYTCLDGPVFRYDQIEEFKND